MKREFIAACAIAFAAAGLTATTMGTIGSSGVGAKMPDGTIYAGISPTTKKPIYALPADAPLTMKWQQAMEYAGQYEGNGHPQGTFRPPTRDELNLLFQNSAKIGGFDHSGLFPGGWYWSSTQLLPGQASGWAKSFGAGYDDWVPKNTGASLRLVRD
jgi:hypothetical protein